MNTPVSLCSDADCRRVNGHVGEHNSRPDEAWDFLEPKDKDKVGKAGYATPRGGDKGAYQNHVYRNNRVIIPFEKLTEVDLDTYADGYIVRLFPSQYFDGPGTPKVQFDDPGAPTVGDDAFVLYRSHASFEDLPPLPGWTVRSLEKPDGTPTDRRGNGAIDVGDYVLRLPRAGKGKPARSEGPAQGIFAPEYATAELNYLSKTMLVWLIVHTKGSPYTTTQAAHVRAVLEEADLLRPEDHEHLGVTRGGLACCPLCLRIIDYSQLHATVTFADTVGLTNAGEQVIGATRSTDVNLFHLVPLVYATLHHAPMSLGWGHATCNTLLGQRRCYSVAELQSMDLKVGVLQDGEIETFGWMSEDRHMIRSPRGAVWVMLTDEMTEPEWRGEVAIPPAPIAEDVLDAAVDAPIQED